MKALLVVSMCFLLGGCLTRPPVIAVDSVEIIERNEKAMAMHYNLVLTNPNDKPIEPLEFTYSVSVEGRGVYWSSCRRDDAGCRWPEAASGIAGRHLLRPYRLDCRDGSRVARWSMSGTLVYVDEGVFAETLLDLGYKPSTSFAASGDLKTVAELGPPSAIGPVCSIVLVG